MERRRAIARKVQLTQARAVGHTRRLSCQARAVGGHLVSGHLGVAVMHMLVRRGLRAADHKGQPEIAVGDTKQRLADAERKQQAEHQRRAIALQLRAYAAPGLAGSAER